VPVNDLEFDNLIGSTMATLTRDVSQSRPVDEVLADVTTAAVKLIAAVHVADVLLIQDGKFRSVAPTSDIAPRLDTVQQDTAEGPCLEAAVGETVIRSDDLSAETRWPTFTAAALDAGVHSILSFQLYTYGPDRGALNLFSFEADSFTAEHEALAAMLATNAAIALIAANREHQFESALASRDIIGQAKGMIMERFGVDAVRAFELLTKLSQDTNTRLVTIAEQLVANRLTPKRDG
jgi:GAF domain-containing protein